MDELLNEIEKDARMCLDLVQENNATDIRTMLQAILDRTLNIKMALLQIRKETTNGK